MGKLAHVQAALNKPKLVRQSVDANKAHEADLVARIAERVAAMIKPSTHTIERIEPPATEDIASVIRREIANFPEPVFEVNEAPKKTDWVFTVERDSDGFIQTITAR